MGLPFVGLRRVVTVVQHHCLAKPLEEKCRRRLHSEVGATQICARDGTDSIFPNGAACWKLMSDGISGKTVKLWYAADVLLHDLNNNHGYEPKTSIACGRYLKRPRKIVYSNLEDDFHCNNSFHEKRHVLTSRL